MQRYDQNRSINSIETHQGSKQSVDRASNRMLCLQKFHGDYFSLFPYDARKEPGIKFTANTTNCPYHALDNVLQSFLMDKSVGNMEYYNLCQWLLKRKIQTDLTPQYDDTINEVRSDCKTVKDNVESVSQRLKISKCDSDESHVNQISIGSYSLLSCLEAINNSMETVKSAEILCNVVDDIPPSQVYYI